MRWFNPDGRNGRLAQLSQSLMEAIPLPLSLRDTSGRFLQVNRAFEEWHAIPRDRLLGHEPAEVLPASVTLAFARCDALAGERAGPVDQEVELRPQDAGMRYVQLRVQTLRDGSGQPVGSIAIESDVTRLREQEVELTTLNEQLSRVSALVIEAQEQERRSMARDFHDDVGQVLSAMKMSVVTLARAPQPVAPQGLLPIVELIDEVIQRVRDLTASLYPQVLDDLGIEPAVEWLLERYVRPHLGDVTLHADLSLKRGDHAVEIVAFRVVQEALTNVLRHSNATQAGVLLNDREGVLCIEVIDDGDGFEAGNTWYGELPGRSIGITSMRNRVEEVGGHFQVDSGPGSGTSIRVWLPWPDPHYPGGRP